MKAILRSVLLATVCTLFTGCFQIERVVSVKADGSGTVTETVILPKAIIAQMKLMTDSFGKALGADAAQQDAKPAPKSPAEPDEAKLREAASKMGEGVTFVSAKKAVTETGEGFTATFAFTDINKLKLDQNPSDAVPTGGPGTEIKQQGPPEIITFQFTKGKTAQLVVNMPQMKPAAKNDKPDKAENAFPGGDEMAMTMMKQMFKDMRMTLAVEVDGKLVKTDADYATGNRVTLMEMDFNKLLANPEKFKALSKANPNTLEETKAFLKGVDGIKIESKPKVSISLQ